MPEKVQLWHKSHTDKALRLIKESTRIRSSGQCAALTLDRKELIELIMGAFQSSLITYTTKKALVRLLDTDK